VKLEFLIKFFAKNSKKVCLGIAKNSAQFFETWRKKLDKSSSLKGSEAITKLCVLYYLCFETYMKVEN
jgi:hypothetical protein